MSEIRDSDLDRYYKDPQVCGKRDAEPIDECVFCGETIFEGEWIWKFPDYGSVCECCIDKYKFRA